VYRANSGVDRRMLWGNLLYMKGKVLNNPWMICGDFNMVHSLAEKWGSIKLNSYESEFGNCLNERVEVEALVNIIAKSIERFLWKNVVYRYGIPHTFVINNGKQFNCDSFRKWCTELHIRNYFSCPGHP
jgi:hypothetical protein